MLSYVQELTPEEIVGAMRIAHSNAIFSDDSGLSNVEKWAFVSEIFQANDITVEASYEDCYASADDKKCRAAWFLSDIRSQVLRISLDIVSDPERKQTFHLQWLLNKRWMVKLRDRAIAFRVLDEIKTELKV